MRIRPGLFTAALQIALVAACAGPPPAPEPEPAGEPIPLGPDGSRPFAFLHVVQRIPAGTLLGIAHFEYSDRVLDEIRASGSSDRDKSFNVAITDVFRENGYTVIDEADAVFEPGRTVRVRYQLAGVLHDVDVDYAYKRAPRYERALEARGRATVQFELQVHDLVENKTVFRQTYQGTGSDTGTKPQPVVPAVVDAVRRAMADPEFVAVVVQRGNGGEDDESVVSQVRIARCQVPASAQPTPMSRTMESVVVVRVGGLEGSGVIVSEEGHILTAVHVVGDRDNEVYMRLHSGLELPARVVSRSQPRDVALFKLPGRGYPCVPTATGGAEPAVGSDVFAVNVSYALTVNENAPTVSRGVVSGYQQHRGRRYLQTDASVNPGSSGGPLFDGNGKVVGIMSEKVFGLGLEGLGLAIPIEEAESAVGIVWE